METKGKANRTLDGLIADDMKDARFRAAVERKIAQIHLEQLLVRLRTTVGVSQGWVARRIGKSQPWVAATEKNPAANMQISTLARLVAASGGSVEIIVKDPQGKKVGAVQVGA